MAYKAGLKEIYGVGKTQEERDEENKKRQKAYEDVRTELNIKSSEVDDDYINQYIEDCNNFSKATKADFNNIGYNNYKSSYRKYLRQSESLSYRANRISEHLQKHKDRYDSKTYNDLMTYLDNGQKSFITARQSFSNARDYYAQWKTEKDYKDYLDGKEERKRALSFDTKKGRNEISVIDRQIESLKKTIAQKKALYNSRYASNGDYASSYNPYENPGVVTPVNPLRDQDMAKMSQEIANYEKQLSDLEKQRTEKSTYYNTAKRLQDNKALTENATNAEDFELYADKGINNEITQLKNKYSNTDSFGEDTTLTKEQRFAKYLTEDELNIYEYYIGKGDAKSAEAYLNSMEETVNSRKGLEIYDLIEDKTALELAFGVAAGLDQFGTGIKSSVSSLFGGEDYYAPSAIQIASERIKEDLYDDGFKIGDRSVAQIGYDFVTTTSNMLPSVLTSAVVGTVGNTIAPGVGTAVAPVVGSVLLGASAAGNAYAEMINLGYDKGQARTYGAMVGASEAGLQLVMGGIGKLGGYATKGLTTKIVGSLDNALAKGAIKFGDAFVDITKGTVKLGGKMFSEGAEEYMQEILDPFFKNLAFNEKNEIKLFTPEALYSGVLGALSAGVLDAVPSSARDAFGAMETHSRGDTALKKGVEIARLKELGQTFSADSVAYKIADRVNKDTGAYTIGKLLNEVGAEITQQNQADISNALAEKGVAPKNAETISKWLARTVDGVELSRAQRKVLENNEVVSDVFRDVIIDKNSTVNQRRQSFFEATKSKGFTGVDQDVMSSDSVRDNYNSKLANNESAENVPLVQSSTEQRLRTASGSDIEADIINLANEVANNGKTSSQQSAYALYADPTTRAKAVIGQSDVINGKSNTTRSIEPQEYDVSAEGKTILNTQNGAEDVEIKGVALTKGKVMTLELADGREVNSKDIAYRSQDEAIVYETVANMEVPTGVADTLIKSYSPKQSGRIYAFGAKQAYDYGYYNMPKAELMTRGFFAQGLTDYQRETAYNLGKAMSKAAFKTEQKSKGYAKGGVVFDGDRSKLTYRQKTSLEAMEKVADLTGVQIRVFESDMVNGKRKGKNGSYNTRTGEIEIDLFAGADGQGIMLHTLSHELIHHIRQWSSEKYKILADFLMEQYGKKGVSVDALVRRQIEKAEASDRKISYAEAHEEVIADSMEAMLTDGKVIEKLQILQTKDQSLFEKIKSAIAELIAKIKKAYKNVKPETLEGQIVASMLDEYETIQQMFVNAIADASENFKNAEVEEAKTNKNNQVKYSFAPIDEESKYNAVSRGHTILETSEDVTKAIDESLKDRNLKNSYILGGIPSDVKNRITKDTNGNVFKKGGYVFKITSDHIRHIEKHFQNTDDILDAIYRLYDVVCNYDSVSPIQNGNQTRLKFEKSYWDYNYLSIEVASRKSRCLDLVTFYITKNNKKRESKIHSPAKSQDLAHQGVSLSDNTVPQNGTDVNTSISENGVKYSFAGREAKTSDIKTLEEAIRLEDVGKATSEEIRQQTGWFRGMDGKWRFEISDRDIEIDTTGKFHTNPDVRRYMELFDKVFVNMNASEEEATELRGLDKNLKGVSFEPRTLGELIKHDKLFAAYPQLKEISVHFADIDERGIYDPISKILVLQSKLKLDKSKLEKTLVHEIQHAIQDIEGFASGSSPDSWQVAGVSKKDAYSYYERTAGEIEARDSATRSWRTDEARKEKRPDIDRTDVIFSNDNIISFAYDNKSEKKEIINTINDNIDLIKKQPIFSVVGEKIPSEMSKSDYILSIFKEQGNMAYNSVLGNVELVKSGAKSTVMHGFGYEKLAAARAIKDVVEKGSIIKIEKNYNNTQVDRYFIAGMGHIDNYPAFLGLIIKAYPTQKNSNAKFYLHETVIIKTDSPIMTAPQLSVDTVSESVYNNSISNPSENVKQKQLEIIEKVNPAPNSYLTWIRKIEDVKTLSETLRDSEWSDYNEFNPDLTRGMLEEAIEKGEITVYSSYQIKQGTFVSPSYMEAESYSGNGKVYEKTVKIDDVAWIDPTQGMYANIDEKYSDRDPDALTPRNLLANALEESAVHEVEKKKLAEYKANIEKLYANEQELYEVRKEIKELSFAPGKRDTAKLKALQEKAVKLSNLVTFYDKKLLNLESTSFLKNVLEREKQKVIKRQKEKDAELLRKQKEKALQKEKEIAERYRESRKKSVESRNRTAMRNKIKRVVNELNQYLLHGTKDKHVIDNMKKVVAEALSILDMDTVGADERVERYNQLIAEATDPDVIASLTETRDRIQGQGDNLNEKLMSLKNAYADIINSTDPVIANAYDKVIEDKIQSVAQSIEGTSLRNMSLTQLEEVYDLYKMVLTNIRDSNKAFKAGRDETISELGYKVNAEVEDVTEQKYKVSAFKDYISKFGWNELKPIYAFRMIGSQTFQRLFNNILRGQDTWYRDVEEGKTFQQQAKEKYGYREWDFKKNYNFEAKNGKTFDLTLQQIMSLYAFSRREQALNHLVQGGIVLDSDVKITERVKGIPVKYKVNTSDAFNLSPETIGEIIDSLTPEQKSFVEEMQSFLSDVMGEKGNEVSLAMYGIKLYKEKFYFPLKSSEYYMNFTAEEAGEVKLKNSGFSKETVKKANNPIVLSDFMDVWAKHVNEMSTYHAFVLPIEDFSRVYNYRTPSSETSTTTSLKNTLNNAFGSGVNKYIRQMLVDVNGGARSTLATPTDKITSLAKKGAVMLSASVVIQQPSAIVRAMAYVKPRYFVNFESLKFAKHNEKWQELKKYAPIAGIKEMGYFDTGMGRSSVDWITEEDYSGIREKLYAFFRDSDARKALSEDILGKAPAMADELSWVALWEAVKKETSKETELEPDTDEFLKRCGERFTEVVELTQVYDSVLSRNGYMRDKGSLMKMATAFMAEPTIQANMLLDAGVQRKRNGRAGRRSASAVIGAVTGSILLNTLLKSLVYAARDDEEDKTLLEKYIGAVAGDLTQSLNPLTMIPFAKDIVSIFSGYDVERMDMSLVADLKDSILAIGSETETTSDKITGLISSIGQLLGVPVKNVIRDAKAIVNVYNSITNGTKTTDTGIMFTLKEEANSTITGNLLGKVAKISFDTSSQKKYYEAVISGDKVYAERMESLFKNPKNSIVDALKKYEPRILKAAQAEIDGKPNERYKIAKEIVADGFKQDYVILAIQGTVSNLTKEEKENKEKKRSLSTVDNYFASALNGDVLTANEHKEAIIQTEMYNTGKTYEEAEKKFYNAFRSAVKDAINAKKLTVGEASEMFEDFGDLDAESAYEKSQYLAFKRDYPELEYDWTENTVTKYYEVAEPVDISVEAYDEYMVGVVKCKGVDANNDGRADTGTVKKEKLEVIDSLPLSNYQKDVLYRLNGWSEKTIWEAPWR